MDQKLRIQYFNKLTNKKNPVGSMDLWYRQHRKTFPVYEINLDYLVYNRFNGRIASLVKSYEKETGSELNPTAEKDIETIEKFLWQSNENSNKATEKNISSQGQLKYGIVTKDGVIIDGNRRAMILKKAYSDESPLYFRAVVLDETLDENAQDIMRLETTYQMGEDAKVDYNPIEKYLKVIDMIGLNFSYDEIEKSMGEKEGAAEEYEEIMKLMDDYLDYLNYSGIYTRLDKTEDLFINLNKILKKLRSDSPGKVQWNCQPDDISAFQYICFDLIRYVYNAPKKSSSSQGIEAKDIREHLARNSENNFFSHKKIWDEFSFRHSENIDTISENEKSIDDLRKDSTSRNLSELLKQRDAAWSIQVDSAIKNNFYRSQEALDNLKNRNEPLKLLQSCLSKLQAIDTESPVFLKDDNVFSITDDIRKKSDEYKRILVNSRKQK